jgi:hypothetical protein
LRSLFVAAAILALTGCAGAEPRHCDFQVEIEPVTRTMQIGQTQDSTWKPGSITAKPPEAKNEWPRSDYRRTGTDDVLSFRALDLDKSRVLVRLITQGPSGFDVCLEGLGTVEDLELVKEDKASKPEGWKQNGDKLRLHLDASKSPIEYRITVKY